MGQTQTSRSGIDEDITPVASYLYALVYFEFSCFFYCVLNHIG